MCGIVGMFATDADSPVNPSRLQGMLHALQHRGPDARQIWEQPGIGLGHARLGILDLDARSNQPMQDAETGLTVVFNGEIYNYPELRSQLMDLGHTFTTNSDTEVLLKAYRQWGVDCLHRFNGMWAFALYDPARRTLFCARDRFGIKPFVYGVNAGGLVFASEAKAIVSQFGEWRRPNLDFLRHFIQQGDFAAYRETFYSGLDNLLPGHYFVVTHGEIPQQKRYWNWQPEPRTGSVTESDALAEFEALLQDAIQLRFRSDVPVGSCLSGGLDSSAIVGLSTRLFQRPIHTFSCVYPDWAEVDESAYIQANVARFGCNAHYITPAFPHLEAMMAQITHEQDGPTGGPSVVSQRAVMALAKGRVKVLLDGQGADEVLGGYHDYLPLAMQSLMRGWLKQPTWQGWRDFTLARKAIVSRVGAQRLPSIRKTLFRACKPVQFERPIYASESVLGGGSLAGLSDLSARLWEDLCLKLPNMLYYEDRNSMAFSLEARLPYLDYRLVQFAFSLPDTFKVRGARTKHLLYEAAKDILPPSVLARKDKMGFVSPGQRWYRQDVESARSLSERLKRAPDGLDMMEPQALERLNRAWADCQQGMPISGHSERLLWRYLTACLWLEQLESPVHPPHASIMPEPMARP